MSFIFYILQILCPSQYSAIGVEAPVLLYERSYNQQVHMQAEKVCLARIVFNESRGESLLSKIYVAQVVINRTKNLDFPKTVCGNLLKKGAFSFYSTKSANRQRKYPKEYDRIAGDVLSGKYNGIHRAVYFKVCSKESVFFNKLEFLIKKGNHCFYR